VSQQIRSRYFIVAPLVVVIGSAVTTNRLRRHGHFG